MADFWIKVPNKNRMCSPIAKISPSYRKSGSLDHWIQWHCHNCSRKLRNSCFCTYTVKMWLKIIRNVVKLQKFPSLFRKLMSLRTTVITDFGPEAKNAKNNVDSAHSQRKMAQNGCKRFLIAEITVSYWKSLSLNQRCSCNYSRKLRNSCFCAHAVKYG